MAVWTSTSGLRDTNRWLLLTVCAGQLLVVALPFFWGEQMPTIVVLALISAVALLISPTTALLYLCVASAVVPTQFSEDYLRLPLNVQFYEGLFAVIVGLSALSWLQEGRLNWRLETRMDRPVLVFLVLVLASMGLGLFYGQSVSQMLRDVRYPLYYFLFFVVAGFFDLRKGFAFVLLMVVAASVVGVEYLVELLESVNLSFEGTFARVSRLEGLMLPIGTLIVAVVMLYDTSFHRQVLCGLALVPIGVALMVTVGRGMWIATAVGICSLISLVFLDRRREPRLLRRVLILMVLPVLIVGMGNAFQRLTGIGLGETAVRRVTRVIEQYETDHSVQGRLLAYGAALEKVVTRPILGGGHGETVTYVTPDEHGIPSVVTLGGVDSTYLTLLLRMGLVGLIAFLWIYVRGVKIAYWLFRRTKEMRVRLFCAAFVAVYCAMMVYGIPDGTLVGNRLIFIHATFLGILARLDAEEPDGDAEEPDGTAP